MSVNITIISGMNKSIELQSLSNQSLVASSFSNVPIPAAYDNWIVDITTNTGAATAQNFFSGFAGDNSQYLFMFILAGVILALVYAGKKYSEGFK